jgi:U3 small nucleolar RNA-associated protein 14
MARKTRLVENVSDSEDEEIDEDEAFNSEDERKYGSFFAGKKKADEDDSDEESDSESDDSIASDEEEEEEDEKGDGGQYMLELLNQLDSKPSTACTNDGALAVHVPESEFAASVVRGTNLTLDSLMEGLEDTKGFRDMQKTLTKVASGKSTSVPLARVVSDRAQRKVHYEEQSQQVSQWMEAVQENRQAESLDFRHKERMDLTKEDLVEKFVPTTDFEKELYAALQQAGQEDEEAILKREEQMMQDDDLGSNKLSMEEYKKRRAQMAKMRALMFYHEQKRHHINKIKSKKYRRIRKKQRERQKEAEVAAQVDDDTDLEKDLEEKEEIERMKERMTLAHKNTSKWAKRVLKRGKNIDVDTRRALSAQLKRGDDLRKKMNAGRDNDEDEDDENEDLVDTARKVLADTEEDHIPIKNQGLFKLSFMQKGIEAQRERAKAEARQLLRELEANRDEQEGSEEEFGDESRNVSKSTKKKVATVAQMKEVLTEGKLVATSLEFGNSNSITVSGGIDIDLSEPGDGSSGGPYADLIEISARTSEHTSTLKVIDNSDDIVFKTDRSKGIKKGHSSKRPAPVREATRSTPTEDANPWLAQGTTGADPVANDAKPKRKKRKTKSNGVLDVNGAVALLGDQEHDDGKQKGSDSVDDEIPSNKPIASLTQEELVRHAFASAPADAEEDFAKEKATVAERDDPTRKPKEQSSKTVSGWGSWTGDGAAPPKPPRKLPKRLQAPEKQLPKRKRQDDKKPHVIINEKRLKKTANQFQIAHIPYPYQSREEYERAMTGAVGKEWNVTSGVKNMTRPEIMTRAGKIIQPISKKVKQRRPAAKF